MDLDIEQQMVADLKRMVTERISLKDITDDDLQDKIEELVSQQLGDQYCSIEQRVSIVEQVFSSIRGFGLLDSIIKDDTITEVMINGPENIFIEQKGRLFKLDKQFESQRKLEDVIQRIVGLAGREVNQANPICDTRLPDGSRVNVVLPPVALCGPTVTIRKFSKDPMTVEKLIEYGSITREIADKLEILVRAKYRAALNAKKKEARKLVKAKLSCPFQQDNLIVQGGKHVALDKCLYRWEKETLGNFYHLAVFTKHRTNTNKLLYPTFYCQFRHFSINVLGLFSTL